MRIDPLDDERTSGGASAPKPASRDAATSTLAESGFAGLRRIGNVLFIVAAAFLIAGVVRLATLPPEGSIATALTPPDLEMPAMDPHDFDRTQKEMLRSFERRRAHFAEAFENSASRGGATFAGVALLMLAVASATGGVYLRILASRRFRAMGESLVHTVARAVTSGAREGRRNAAEGPIGPALEASSGAAPPEAIKARLRALEALVNDGLVSADEAAAKRREILAQL